MAVINLKNDKPESLHFLCTPWKSVEIWTSCVCKDLARFRYVN